MSRQDEYTVQEVQSLLESPTPPKLIDVREQREWDIVHLPGALLVTDDLINEMVGTWERSQPIVCYCHHGIRSLNAARYLLQRGFTNVRSMRGGIEAWSREIEPALPRY
jgi:rhodanese-related sulfurtransferase